MSHPRGRSSSCSAHGGVPSLCLPEAGQLAGRSVGGRACAGETARWRGQRRPGPRHALSQAPCHRPHWLTFRWPFCVCPSSPPLPGEFLQLGQRGRVSERPQAAHCYCPGHNQELSFSKRRESGGTQGGPRPPPRPPCRVCGSASPFLPQRFWVGEAGQYFRALPPPSGPFWLLVRACLMENKTKEVISLVPGPESQIHD